MKSHIWKWCQLNVSANQWLKMSLLELCPSPGSSLPSYLFNVESGLTQRLSQDCREDHANADTELNAAWNTANFWSDYYDDYLKIFHMWK